jgi:hypothetical protein
VELTAILLVALAIVGLGVALFASLSLPKRIAHLPLQVAQEHTVAISRLCDTVDKLSDTIRQQAGEANDRILAAANPLGFQSVKSYEAKTDDKKPKRTRMVI